TASAPPAATVAGALGVTSWLRVKSAVCPAAEARHWNVMVWAAAAALLIARMGAMASAATAVRRRVASFMGLPPGPGCGWRSSQRGHGIPVLPQQNLLLNGMVFTDYSHIK